MLVSRSREPLVYTTSLLVQEAIVTQYHTQYVYNSFAARRIAVVNLTKFSSAARLRERQRVFLE